MGKHAQFVMGPAGSGKTTYCQVLQKHCDVEKRVTHIINLDPAADNYQYDATVDIRTLITVEDVVEEYKYGPNGALVYCMEFLADNLDWLEESIGDFEDDYLIIDCPGQVELYTHLPVMTQVVSALQRWGYTCASVYLLDSQFVTDPAKFISGMVMCLSAMVRLELPHVNVLSKIDLLKQQGFDIETLLGPSVDSLVDDASKLYPQWGDLNAAIGSLIEDYSLVSFVPVDISSEDSLTEALLIVDQTLQYGDDVEPKEIADDYEDD